MPSKFWQETLPGFESRNAEWTPAPAEEEHHQGALGKQICRPNRLAVAVSELELRRLRSSRQNLFGYARILKIADGALLDLQILSDYAFDTQVLCPHLHR